MNGAQSFSAPVAKAPVDMLLGGVDNDPVEVGSIQDNERNDGQCRSCRVSPMHGLVIEILDSICY